LEFPAAFQREKAPAPAAGRTAKLFYVVPRNRKIQLIGERN
jgi:hypothetical protein